jgi:hypothetical protein
VVSEASGKRLDEDSNTITDAGAKVQTWACKSQSAGSAIDTIRPSLS